MAKQTISQGEVTDEMLMEMERSLSRKYYEWQFLDPKALASAAFNAIQSLRKPEVESSNEYGADWVKTASLEKIREFLVTTASWMDELVPNWDRGSTPPTLDAMYLRQISDRLDDAPMSLQMLDAAIDLASSLEYFTTNRNAAGLKQATDALETWKKLISHDDVRQRSLMMMFGQRMYDMVEAMCATHGYTDDDKSPVNTRLGEMTNAYIDAWSKLKRENEQLTSLPDGEQLIKDAAIVCKVKGWSPDAVYRGGYLFLEISELVESIRGKGDSNPTSEAGDVIFSLVALLAEGKVTWRDALRSARMRIDDFMQDLRIPKKS